MASNNEQYSEYNFALFFIISSDKLLCTMLANSFFVILLFSFLTYSALADACTQIIRQGMGTINKQRGSVNMKNQNILTVQHDQVESAINILTQFKHDPKAQRCLDIYRKLPSDKQDILLIVMDAFVVGAEAGAKISRV